MGWFLDDTWVARSRKAAARRKAIMLLESPVAVRTVWLAQMANENSVFYQLVVEELSRRESKHDNQEHLCE